MKLEDLEDPHEYIRQVFCNTVRALVNNREAVIVEICRESKTVAVRIAPEDLPLLLDNGLKIIRSLRSLLIAATKSHFQQLYVLDLKPLEADNN